MTGPSNKLALELQQKSFATSLDVKTQHLANADWSMLKTHDLTYALRIVRLQNLAVAHHSAVTISHEARANTPHFAEILLTLKKVISR